MQKYLAAFLALTLAATAVRANEANGGVERYYCTQYGPFFFRFDPDKAAGVFAILTNNDLGSVVGRMDGRAFEGEWFEVDSRGDIRIFFAEDWSSFEVEYSIAGEPEEWLTGWKGRLRPEPATVAFTANDETYRCQ